LNLGFGGRVSGRLGHFGLAGRRCHCFLCRLGRRFADAGCLGCGQGFLLLLTEGFHGTLDGLLHVCGGLGQALLDRLLDVFNLGCRLDSVCIFSGGRCRSSGGGCLHGGLVDHLRRTVTFACCDRFRCSHGDGRRQNRLIAGVLLAALLTGIFRLCGTAAATVIAAALAVARTAFGTVLSGVRIVVGLLLGLVDPQLLVLRCGLLPAGLSPLFLAAFLGAGALLLGVLRRGGAGSAAATTTAAGAAAFAPGTGAGLGDLLAGNLGALALIALALLTFATIGTLIATLGIALSTLGAFAALAPVAVGATITAVAAAIAGRLAFAGAAGLLLCFAFRAVIAGEHADQGLDQRFDQSRLGLLDRTVGCRHRSRGGGRCRGRAGRCNALDRCLLADDGAGLADRSRLLLLHIGAHGIAGYAIENGLLIVPAPLHRKVRGNHVRGRQNQQANLGARVDLGQYIPLLVEQEGADGNRYVGTHFGGAILQRLFLDQTQYRQGQRFNVTDGAPAITARADDAAGLAQRRAQTLTGHLQQTETGNAAYLHPGAVGFQTFADTLFHGTLVLGGRHVDEVDDDQAADVTQAQLTGDFLGGFEVGLQRSLLDVATLGGTGRVDVDGNQGFGVVDDDGTAGGQLDLTVECRLDLALDLEAVEQRYAVLVQLHLARILRHYLADEVEGFFLDRFVVNQHLADVLAQVIADGADDDVAFLVDQ